MIHAYAKSHFRISLIKTSIPDLKVPSSSSSPTHFVRILCCNDTNIVIFLGLKRRERMYGILTKPQGMAKLSWTSYRTDSCRMSFNRFCNCCRNKLWAGKWWRNGEVRSQESRSSYIGQTDHKLPFLSSPSSTGPFLKVAGSQYFNLQVSLAS